MKRIGYKGAVDVGYRYDDRDSRYKVNDINPRVCAMLRCFVGQNGMDVVRAVYQDMTEQSVMSAWARNGRKWIVEDRDLRSAFWHYREGRLSFKQWRESLRGVEQTSYISLDDPAPILGRLLRAGGIRGQVPGRLARLGVQPRQDG